MISFEEWVRATYSASVLDKVIIGCFLELQETTPFPMKKAKPHISQSKIAIIMLKPPCFYANTKGKTAVGRFF
jgi:hypothetical protein